MTFFFFDFTSPLSFLMSMPSPFSYNIIAFCPLHQNFYFCRLVVGRVYRVCVCCTVILIIIAILVLPSSSSLFPTIFLAIKLFCCVKTKMPGSKTVAIIVSGAPHFRLYFKLHYKKFRF